MRPPLTFIRFEIQQRQHSPNCVVGITDTNRTVLVAAPGTALGKVHGDQLALEIKTMLEHKYRLVVLEFSGKTASVMECPNCKHLQKHTYPSSGKLYCAGCGTLIEEIDPELELLSCPGDHIKETIEYLGIDINLFVIKMQMSNTDASALLKGYLRITPEIATKLHEITNVDAQFWLNLENNYRAKLNKLTHNHNHDHDQQP